MTTRDWCCGAYLDKPHIDGCPFAPESGHIDYQGPAVIGRLPVYLGDGAWAEMGNWVGQTCVYTTIGGGVRANKVYLEIDMIDKLHAWVHQND